MKHMLLFIFLIGTGSLHAAAEDSHPGTSSSASLPILSFEYHVDSSLCSGDEPEIKRTQIPLEDSGFIEVEKPQSWEYKSLYEQMQEVHATGMPWIAVIVPVKKPSPSQFWEFFAEARDSHTLRDKLARCLAPGYINGEPKYIAVYEHEGAYETIYLGPEEEYNEKAYGLLSLLQIAYRNPHVLLSIAQRYDVLNDTSQAILWYKKVIDFLLNQPNIDYNVCDMLSTAYQALGILYSDPALMCARLAQNYADAERSAKIGLQRLVGVVSTYSAPFNKVYCDEIASRCASAEIYLDRGWQYEDHFLDEVEKFFTLPKEYERELLQVPEAQEIICRRYCLTGLAKERKKPSKAYEQYRTPFKRLCSDKDDPSQIALDVDDKIEPAKHALFALAGHLLYDLRDQKRAQFDFSLSGAEYELYAKLFTSSVSNDTRSFQVAHAVHTFKKKWPERFERAQETARYILDQVQRIKTTI